MNDTDFLRRFYQNVEPRQVKDERDESFYVTSCDLSDSLE